MKKPFCIGMREIGGTSKPFLLAEMSGNHNGSLERALRIVREAAANGADAIKLQTFTASTLTIDSHRPEFYIRDPHSAWNGRRLWDLYKEAHTPWEWHEPIFKEARAAGLGCISTAFDERSLEFLARLDVDAIKISSFELVHLPLLKHAAQTGKPILLSTGMATLDEIDEAVDVLRAHRGLQFILLKCTSAYPADERDADILAMQNLAARYGCEVGLSDHCLRPYAAFAAVALGASIIEKHLTLDRGLGGVDASFSLEPFELKELSKGLELVWCSRGKVCYGVREAESTSRKERPSIYVIHSMTRGERFTRDNVRVIRPGNGLPPRVYEAILGRESTQDLAAGTPLSWECIRDGKGTKPSVHSAVPRSGSGGTAQRMRRAS
jgi:N-acetylneuraminate synthase